MSIRNFKFLEQEKEPQFQFRNIQVTATHYVAELYDNQSYINIQDVQPFESSEGVYRIVDITISFEDNVKRINSCVNFYPHGANREITLNVEFIDYSN
jgi:hypothetical protein